MDSHSIEIQESILYDDSREVSTYIAGYISRKLDEKRPECPICKSKLFATEDDLFNCNYLKSLSRGGLAVPSPTLECFIRNCFAALDYVSEFIHNKNILNVRGICSRILQRYAPAVNFTCKDHCQWGIKFASIPVINCFFNNRKKLDNDSVRKDNVSEFKRSKRQKICYRNIWIFVLYWYNIWLFVLYCT